MMRAMRRGLVAMLATAYAGWGQSEGSRPYEMEWIGRTEDDRPPLVDFEQIAPWRVECEQAEATFERSREQRLWGDFVAKLTYRGTGPGPTVRLIPPQPIPIDHAFDAVSMWIYGNNIFGRDPSTPPTTVTLHFVDAEDRTLNVPLKPITWKEWFLCHRRLDAPAIERFRRGGAFTGLTLTNGRNQEDRVLYFDNLAVFVEAFKPLNFAARRRRGVAVFPGRDTGLNRGEGVLPFPTRSETIVPPNLTPEFTNSVIETNDAFVLRYEGIDGVLTARLPTAGCQWDGIELHWQGNGKRIFPCSDGGLFFATVDDEALPPERVVLRSSRIEGDWAASTWEVLTEGGNATVYTRVRLLGKSLVIDIDCRGGVVAEVRFGAVRGPPSPRLVTFPYYTYGQSARPAVLVSAAANETLFLMQHIDWTLSNSSQPWAENRIDPDIGAVCNGGTRYHPKTNGERNDCFERFVISLSPHLEEVLPIIPNPTSPWKHLTGTRLWRAHGAGNRERDAEYWRRIHRYGITEMVVTDHETGWRDGEESFTFRTRAAPGKGGDAGQYRYARIMQDELGFIYGPYNNFTDFAPVNEFWSFDMVSRTRDNQLQTAWRRCYAPKPTRAVEYCEKLTPIIQEKFHFSTAYCDVHTAVTPWSRTDYDWRVPGAATFAQVFYAFGEIMLLQKQTWDGPVYSEGNNHFPYCGLTDGNYAQDQRYGLPDNPWLVDFDLLRMHDLCCNFGMGNLQMFYGRDASLGNTPRAVDASIDRFLAATVAFGHPGFLVMQGGWRNTLRSYYMIQQLHSRYTLGRAERIRYVDDSGRQLTTEEALATEVYRRNQIVTHYDNGCLTVVNGSKDRTLHTTIEGRRIELSPNGYAGWTRDGRIDIFSGEINGHRADLAVTPAYTYVDGRNHFVRFEHAAGNGPGICRHLDDGTHEVILIDDSDCGFALQAGRAEALNQAGEPMGEAPLRRGRGLTYVIPVEGAFSYRLHPGRLDGITLTAERDTVVPGESVTVHGRQDYALTVPREAQPGTRLWKRFEGSWIDFTVLPLCTATYAVDGRTLAAAIRSHHADELQAEIRLGTQTRECALRADTAVDIALDLGMPAHETPRTISLSVSANGMLFEDSIFLLAIRDYEHWGRIPSEWSAVMRLRDDAEERSLVAESGASARLTQISCGGDRRTAIRMHPPWKTGVGYTAVIMDEMVVPERPSVVLRAAVGKGDGSHLGDGILYHIAVLDADGSQHRVASRHVSRHEWLPIAADLSPWRGRSIRLKLITDVGNQDNSEGDWGCWADMKLQSAEKTMRWKLQEEDGMRQAPPIYPVAAVTPQLLRSARRGWLHYDGAGLEGGSGQYATTATVNGVDIGPTQSAHGDPANNVWVENLRIPLTPAAIGTLDYRNTCGISNPRQDWFKVRRFWIELELPDGTRCSSTIAVDAFTQPPNWPYAEGRGVPHGQDIRVQVWFGAETDP